MVHELIGLNNNRVVLESTEDKKNFVLSPRHDDFYAKVLSPFNIFKFSIFKYIYNLYVRTCT